MKIYNKSFKMNNNNRYFINFFYNFIVNKFIINYLKKIFIYNFILFLYYTQIYII